MRGVEESDKLIAAFSQALNFRSEVSFEIADIKRCPKRGSGSVGFGEVRGCVERGVYKAPQPPITKENY